LITLAAGLTAPKAKSKARLLRTYTLSKIEGNGGSPD
jgi:hypothetical protein